MLCIHPLFSLSPSPHFIESLPMTAAFIEVGCKQQLSFKGREVHGLACFPFHAFLVIELSVASSWDLDG